MKKSSLVIMLMCAFVALTTIKVYAAVTNSQPAPDFTLLDSNGDSRSLSDFSGKYVVLEWVNYDCPFVKKHYQYGDMQSLQKDLTGRDVVWLSINSSAAGKQGFYSPEEINQVIENSDASPTAYLYDTDGDVGREYGAKTTPHMFVVDPAGILIYQGAIDSIPSVDSADVGEADNYVVQALSEAAAAQAVSMPLTKPYGCSVKY